MIGRNRLTVVIPKMGEFVSNRHSAVGCQPQYIQSVVVVWSIGPLAEVRVTVGEKRRIQSHGTPPDTGSTVGQQIRQLRHIMNWVNLQSKTILRIRMAPCWRRLCRNHQHSNLAIQSPHNFTE